MIAATAVSMMPFHTAPHASEMAAATASPPNLSSVQRIFPASFTPSQTAIILFAKLSQPPVSAFTAKRPTSTISCPQPPRNDPKAPRSRSRSFGKSANDARTSSGLVLNNFKNEPSSPMSFRTLS